MFWTNVLYNYFSWLFALSSCLPPPWPAWGWLVTPTMSQRSQHPSSSPQTTSPPTTSPPFSQPPTNFPPTKHIVSIPGWFAQHAAVMMTSSVHSTVPSVPPTPSAAHATAEPPWDVHGTVPVVNSQLKINHSKAHHLPHVWPHQDQLQASSASSLSYTIESSMKDVLNCMLEASWISTVPHTGVLPKWMWMVSILEVLMMIRGNMLGSVMTHAPRLTDISSRKNCGDY